MFAITTVMRSRSGATHLKQWVTADCAYCGHSLSFSRLTHPTKASF
ncbi:MAG: hypothetical protein ACLFV6_17915 [Spirulinaceae cyanobacterium]